MYIRQFLLWITSAIRWVSWFLFGLCYTPSFIIKPLDIILSRFQDFKFDYQDFIFVNLSNFTTLKVFYSKKITRRTIGLKSWEFLIIWTVILIFHSNLSISNNIWQYLIVSDTIWQYLTVYDSIWQYLTVSDNIW